jgi:hypothetical protein
MNNSSESLSFSHSAVANHRPEDVKLMVAISTILCFFML